MHHLYGKVPVDPSLFPTFNPINCGYSILLEDGNLLLNEDTGLLYLETLCSMSSFFLLLEDGGNVLLEDGIGEVLLEG